MATVHLLSNPQARGGRTTATDASVAKAVEAHGHQVIPLHPDGVAGIATTLRQARQEGMTRLIVAGGDGLVHHCLGPLAGTGVILGIVPGGTGNDFARALGLPTKLQPAVAAALEPANPVDLMVTDDGRYAASVVTGGFSGQVNARANRLRFPPGQQRYTVATLLELPRLRPLTLSLTVDGTVEEHPSTLFAVANTRFFGGGMAICPDARPDDGLLDITIVGPVSRLVLARVLPTVFSGRHVNHPQVTTRRGRHIRLEVDAPLWADGESFAGSCLSVAPAALQVAGSLVTTDREQP